MKKAIIFLILLTVFTNCSETKDAINIPEGEYVLSSHRNLASLLCDMSDATFGKSIIINNGMINTNPMEGAESTKYKIKAISENEFLTTAPNPVSQDSTTLQFSFDTANKQLVFSCNNGQIVYQKK